MLAQINALKQSRKDLIDRSRAIWNRCEQANRQPNSEELAEIDKLHADAKSKGDEASQLEKAYQRQQEAEAELASSTGRRTRLKLDKGRGDPSRCFTLKLGRDARRKVKTVRIRPDMAAHRRCLPEYREGFRGYLTGQQPAAVMQTDVASAGGYLAPEQFNAEVIRELDDVVWIRQIARTFMIDGPTMGTPTRDARAASAARGSELGEPTPDTALKFGKRELAPHYITGAIDVSRDLMRCSAVNVEGIVGAEIVLDVSYLEEQEFMTGTGAGLQALGIFTASDLGIPTSRDVTAASATELDADVLRAAKYKIKQQYRMSPALRWVFHRDAIAQLSKLKTGAGEYLWQAGMRFGDPDELLGIPLAESEFAPSTFSASSYVGALGDFRYYWIVDGMGLEIQRLVEVKAGANQDRFIYRRKMDAQPVLAAAFARIKLAAS